MAPEASYDLVFANASLQWVDDHGPVTVIQKVYLHRLPDREQVIEWVRGTLITAYERRMPAVLWKDFLRRYREVLFAELPDEKPFLYPFKRLLAWSIRA